MARIRPAQMLLLFLTLLFVFVRASEWRQYSSSQVFRHRHLFCSNLDDLHFGALEIDIRDSAELIFTNEDSTKRLAKLNLRGIRDFPAETAAQYHYDEITQHRRYMADEHIIPNTSDKETVVNLAKMTSDAYILDPRQPDWRNISFGFNFTCRFGWEEDGLRGHVFATEDNSTVVVAFKGTTIDPREETPAKDRINDNRLFGCCCAAQTPYFYSPVCNCSTGYYQCNSDCVTQSILQNDTYYAAAMEVMWEVRRKYPRATLWTVGHSLGGSLASLVGLTFNIPSVTFEAPPERLPAQRMGLLPANTSSRSDRRHMAYHFGNTADPVYMGACNGYFSSCAVGGFSFESQCFSGKRCAYDTVRDKHWRTSIANHRINYVIDNVLEAYDDVATCESDDECEDCFNWKFS